MSDNFVVGQYGFNGSSTTPQLVLSGVTVGNTIVAILVTGSSAAPTGTGVSDAQGAYTAKGSPVTSAPDTTWAQVYVLQNANAGSHTIVGAISTAGYLIAGEIGTTGGTSAYSDAKGAVQTSPGAGANVLSSGSLTIPQAATIFAAVFDISSSAPGDEPTAGTSPIAFTSRDAQSFSGVGVVRIETGAASGNAAATGGPITTTHNFLTIGVAILNAAPAGGGRVTKQPAQMTGGFSDLTGGTA